jgi:uncharacterized protein YkwD
VRRICLIVLCLLVAGVAGGATAASAHNQVRHQIHLAQRHALCQKHERHMRSQRCRRTRHSDVRSAGQSSDDPPTVLPPLEELIAPEAACPGQSDESLSVASQEATMGCMINFARSTAGVADVADVAVLDDSSAHKAIDIVQCDEFSHSACGRDFTYWFEQNGYLQPGGCQQAGENLAWGTGVLGTVRSILTAWVNSPEHLANMLAPSYDEFGVGMDVGPLNGYPDAHVWATHFGSHC